MRFIHTLFLGLALTSPTLFGPVEVAAKELTAEQKRDLNGYAAHVRRQVEHGVKRLPSGTSGEAHLQFKVCPSGEVTITAIRSGNAKLRDFIRKHLAVTKFPRPPASLGGCIPFGVPIIFH